jgi:hypothetical protein
MSLPLIVNVGVEPADLNIASKDFFASLFDAQSLFHGFADNGFSPWGPSNVCPAILQ